MKMPFDYISILAGGSCTQIKECTWCVGNEVRANDPPHFASYKNVCKFLDLLQDHSTEFSISGVSSDPILCKDTGKIIDYALGKYSISLHTKILNTKTEMYSKYVDELCLSVHRMIPSIAQKLKNIEPKKLRISSVCTSENIHLFESPEFFELYGATRFTIRKNIREPELRDPVIPYDRSTCDQYGQKWFEGDGKTIALWDFKKANREIKAMYLWPTGEMNEQCYWKHIPAHQHGVVA